jgi:hypothetical protein
VSVDSPAVVVAPDTEEEAKALCASLRSGGFHPTLDEATDPGGPRLANHPILVPQPELKEAQAYLRGLRSQAASAPPPGGRSAAAQHAYDLPPPEPLLRTVTKTFAVVGVLVLLTLGIIAVVLVLQLLGRLITGRPA